MKTVLERFGARLEISGMHPTISFNLDRAPGPLPQTVQNQRFSGSATSVRILGKEMLDLFTQHVQQWVPEGWWRGHDPRKRAIQVWRITAFHPETGLESAPVSVYNKSYHFGGKHEGDSSAWFTIHTDPLDCTFADPTSAATAPLKIRLYRKLMLQSGADQIVETLWVRTDDQSHQPVKFRVHYFAHMDMGIVPEIHRDPKNRWFSIGWPHGYAQTPQPGYGFITNCELFDFKTGRDVPDGDLEPVENQVSHKRFLWEIGTCEEITAVHLFMHGEGGKVDEFAIKTKTLWESLFKDNATDLGAFDA